MVAGHRAMRCIAATFSLVYVPFSVSMTSQTSTQRWLEFALVFLVFFVEGGALVPHVNEAHYLCKAKHYWQPDWLAGDAFLESADAHVVFYWTLGWLTRLFSLPAVAWIGRVAAWGFLAWAWQRLVRRVARQPYFSVIGAMLLVVLVREAHFAGEWIVGGVEAKCFAYVFVLLGLDAVAGGDWRRCWPLFGLASMFHPVVGGWAVVASGVVWLMEPTDRRTKLLRMLPWLVLGGVFALPGLLPVLALSRGQPADVIDKARQIYVFDRLPHHLAPLSKPVSWIAERALRHGLLIVGLWIISSYLWLRTAPLRLGKVDNPATRPAAMLQSLAALERILRFAWASLGLSAFGLVAEIGLSNRPSLAARVLRFYWFRLADIAVPLAGSLSILFLVVWLSRSRSKWATAVLLAAVCLPGWVLLSVSIERFRDRCPPAERAFDDVASWHAACHWAGENTPPDARFFVPRYGYTFKWYAQRSDVATWKDIPQDAAGIVAWRDRCADIYYYDWDAGRLPYPSLAVRGTAKILELAEKYEVDYLLTRNYIPLQLPVVYTNECFVIYRTNREDANHTEDGNHTKDAN